MPLQQKLLMGIIIVVLVSGAIAAMISLSHEGLEPGPNRVWSEEHQHWH